MSLLLHCLRHVNSEGTAGQLCKRCKEVEMKPVLAVRLKQSSQDVTIFGCLAIKHVMSKASNTGETPQNCVCRCISQGCIPTSQACWHRRRRASHLHATCIRLQPGAATRTCLCSRPAPLPGGSTTPPSGEAPVLLKATSGGQLSSSWFWSDHGAPGLPRTVCNSIHGAGDHPHAHIAPEFTCPKFSSCMG